MNLASIKEVSEGQTISFRSKNINDPTVWQGTLESIGTYRSIRGYRYPVQYNEAVRQSDPTVSSDITTLTYFLITIENSSDTVSQMQVFADEWISPGTLNQLSLGNTVNLVVTDPFKNTQNILSLLAGAGYACRVLP